MYRSVLCGIWLALSCVAGAQTLTIYGGDGQHVPRQGSKEDGGVAIFRPLAVKLRDADGRGVEGREIEFLLTRRASGMEFKADRTSATAYTNTNGIAVLSDRGLLESEMVGIPGWNNYGQSIQAFHADGPLEVDAVYRQSGHQKVTFHLEVDPKAGPRFPYTAKVISGDHQAVTWTRHRVSTGALETVDPTRRISPITIEARDAQGRPAAWVDVRTKCIAIGYGSCSATRYGRVAGETDRAGRFTLDDIRVSNDTGQYKIQFTSDTMPELDVTAQVQEVDER